MSDRFGSLVPQVTRSAAQHPTVVVVRDMRDCIDFAERIRGEQAAVQPVTVLHAEAAFELLPQRTLGRVKVFVHRDVGAQQFLDPDGRSYRWWNEFWAVINDAHEYAACVELESGKFLVSRDEDEPEPAPAPAPESHPHLKTMGLLLAAIVTLACTAYLAAFHG